RLALYFQRIAPTVKNVYEILSDTALSEVVRTSLGLPAEIANSDVDMQAKLIEKSLDLADLQDPAKLDKLIAKFLAFYELENGATDPVLSLFQGTGEISGDLLATLATLKAQR